MEGENHMRIKRIVILIIIVLFLMAVSSCMSSTKNEPQQNTSDSNDDVSTNSASIAENIIASNNIENLPNELYIAHETDGNECWAALMQMYTFSVKEETAYLIESKIDTGELKLSIKYQNGDASVYDTQDATALDDSIVLKKGTYRVIVSGKIYNGYLHIFNEQGTKQ